MNNYDIKIEILNRLLSRNIFIQKVTDNEIRTRCPFCGDSRKDLRTGHLYLNMNLNNNRPIVYNCFKCPAQGILKSEDLELLGIDDIDIKNNIKSLNKTSDKISKNDPNIDEPYKYFEYEVPEICNRYKIEYMENRLGLHFTDEQLKDMKVITSLKDFLILNKINKITCDTWLANLLENRYIGYLSNNNSYILFRDVTDTQNISWFKYYITEESRGQKVFYSMKSEVDLYTQDDIIINISEGVMDCISIAYNLNNIGYNILNIAICGKFYHKMVNHLLKMGFIGSNIIINLYVDNDKTYDTSLKYFKNILKKQKCLVKEINVIYNLLYKDCGVRKEQIVLQYNKL